MAAASSYVSTVTALRNALALTGIPVAVGPLVEGARAPAATITALAAAGVPADVVGFKPAPAAGKNLWTTTNLPQLRSALEQAFGDGPPLLVDGVAATSSASDFISRAACLPSLQAVVLDQLILDKPLQAAAAAAQRGTVVCPGLAAGVEATTLTVSDLDQPVRARVDLGCSRDCLYLVTLTRADGTPVVAVRGALRGGAPAVPIILARTKLAAPTYVVDVRLVAQVNPGEVVQLLDPSP